MIMMLIMEMVFVAATIQMSTIHSTLEQAQKAAAPIQAIQSILLETVQGFAATTAIIAITFDQRTRRL